MTVHVPFASYTLKMLCILIKRMRSMRMGLRLSCGRDEANEVGPTMAAQHQKWELYLNADGWRVSSSVRVLGWVITAFKTTAWHFPCCKIGKKRKKKKKLLIFLLLGNQARSALCMRWISSTLPLSDGSWLGLRSRKVTGRRQYLVLKAAVCSAVKAKHDLPSGIH